MRPPALTARQEEVAARLHTDYGWSALQIAAAAGCGRRAVENALRRQGVDLRKGARMHAGPNLPLTTGREWLADAGQLARAAGSRTPPKKELADGTMVFKRRRCQNCETMTEYAKQCPRCGEPMDLLKDPPSADIDDLIKEQTL